MLLPSVLNEDLHIFIRHLSASSFELSLSCDDTYLSINNPFLLKLSLTLRMDNFVFEASPLAGHIFKWHCIFLKRRTAVFHLQYTNPNFPCQLFTSPCRKSLSCVIRVWTDHYTNKYTVLKNSE